MQRRRSEPAVLAIDLGTSSVRTAFFDFKARPILDSSYRQEYRVRHSADHGAELNPAVLLRSTRQSLRQTRVRCRVMPPAIAGSAFWHSLLGLDRAGKPLTPVYTWADARGAGDAVRLRTEFDEREIQQRTGCMLRASFWPAKLRWLRRTQPQLFRRVTRWVSPGEWIFEKIWNIRACSHSMASGTGLYNFARRDWDDELVEACCLKRAQLGSLQDVVDNGGPVIFPAIGDGAASNVGSGASGAGVVAINIGTSAAVRTILAADGSLPLGLFRYLVDRKRSLLGGAVSNAGNLHVWCRRELRLPETDRDLEEILRRETARRLTVLPFWVSERAPSWPDHLEGAILGLTQATTAGDLLRATTAAVAYRLADILELLEKAIGRAKKIIVSGGILPSPAALQILANALGRNLETCANQEASLRGAAVHALEQLGTKVPLPKRGRTIRPQAKTARRGRAERARQRQLEKLLTSAPALSAIPLPAPPSVSRRRARK